ncbi:hypothetical protein VTO42DRAFT_4242 [Malbranchea cinnamomea]
MSAPPPPKVHKRAYQACIPCRERRVRCDLGSVDSPHNGPCGRCRRERKFCHFSATRGKKKAGSNVTIPATEVAARAAQEAGVVLGTPLSSTGTAIKCEFTPRSTMATVRPQPNPQGGDKTAATLLRDAAYTSHDALKLLWEAGRLGERVSSETPAAVRDTKDGAVQGVSRDGRPPEASTAHSSGVDPILQPWTNLRFVRTGLFTAEEALDLVNYFHAYLAPFTPISSSYYQDPSMHQKLLEEEPILAVTILMLASRYMKFSGPGAVSRAYMIHERLWQHLQGMISRMIFGQEQFTGGTNDTGSSTEPTANNAASESALAGSSFGSLRTLGTCEALLLLSEWHPRSLHVPAGDDGDSLLVRDDTRRARASATGIGGRIRIDWLEPVWRSDRMCWSMLGNALALAVELGIFDEYDNTTIGARESRRDIWNNPVSSKRAYLVQHLLWVYLTQTSGRLGWKNLTTVSVTDQDASVKHGDTIRCWVGVASLMKRGNELLFPSRERTRELIKNGEYLAVLRTLNPLLQDWQREFDRAKLSKPMRSILNIEFAYVRVYINSVALQAVVEHCTRSSTDGSMMPVSTMLNPYEGNQEYFMEVVTAARSLLQTVVEELIPEDRLKHVPIRTYSRILAGAMFCLKSYALGSKDSENAVSLELVERTAEALCTCVVDDVHLSNRFGELLQALASSLRSRVVRMAPSESSLSRNITPSNSHTTGPSGNNNNHNHNDHNHGGSNAPLPRPAYAMYEPMPPTEVNVSVPESYERSMDAPPGPDHTMLSNAGYDARTPATMPSTGTQTPGYASTGVMGTFPDAQAMQQDPLISFAGLGPNQLGWSGGQDFFDMLGPLLDVQYEQYR